jgi:hypothetical protein
MRRSSRVCRARCDRVPSNHNARRAESPDGSFRRGAWWRWSSSSNELFHASCGDGYRASRGSWCRSSCVEMVDWHEVLPSKPARLPTRTAWLSRIVTQTARVWHGCADGLSRFTKPMTKVKPWSRATALHITTASGSSARPRGDLGRLPRGGRQREVGLGNAKPGPIRSHRTRAQRFVPSHIAHPTHATAVLKSSARGHRRRRSRTPHWSSAATGQDAPRRTRRRCMRYRQRAYLLEQVVLHTRDPSLHMHSPRARESAPSLRRRVKAVWKAVQARRCTM